MKNIPVFNTQYGVASLTLREIPYRRRAYIKLLSSLSPAELTEECIGFCRACGAEWIAASGDTYLEKYPKITAIVAMQRSLAGLPKADACLFPVTEDTVQQWLDVYNARMADVPNAAYFDSQAGKELLSAGDGYFVHRDGKLLGIGKAAGDTVDAVIAVTPGSGETVMQALCELLTGEIVKLQVADNNFRAVKLYERMGFVTTGEVSSWHWVL